MSDTEINDGICQTDPEKLKHQISVSETADKEAYFGAFFC